MNQTQQDRARAAEAVKHARRFRKKYEPPTITLRNARDRLIEQAGRHLVNYATNEDPTGYAHACALDSARAAALLTERYCRIYLDRDNY